MKALSSGDVRGALATIGRDHKLRARLIQFLKELEPSLAAEGLNVREEVTGPLVDALYAEGEVVQRTLASGVALRFPYRSKIARDFVMADEVPDHAWEPQTTKLLLLLGEGTKNAIIGGAYFGDQAVPLAHAIAAAGGVCHCFDLNPEQLSYLEQNGALNGLRNLRINQLGLWDKDDSRLVLVGDDSHAYSKEASEGGEANSTPTVSIDSYARSQGLQTIELIMLDIEGAELPALRGARRFLEQPAASAPRIVFEVHRSYTDWSNGLAKSDVCAFLLDLGYRVLAIRDYQSNVPMQGRPVELVPIDDIYLEGPPHGFNMLAIKDPALLDRPEIRIVPGVSPKLLFHRDPRWHQPRS
jgi:FkbM family methyltransferase